MAETVDLFWSFRSPYSYLATGRALALTREYDIEIAVRPVYPLAVRDPNFFTPANAKRARYIRRDAPRVAEMLGIPFAWPRPDPIVQNMDTLEIAAEQPFIYRLTALGVEAQRRGRGLPFIAEVSALIFGGTKGWNEGGRLAETTARAGLDLDELDAAIGEDHGPGSAHGRTVAENQAALETAGHWGVPTFVFRGEPFFGQDRIDMLAWWLDKADVPRR